MGRVEARKGETSGVRPARAGEDDAIRNLLAAVTRDEQGRMQLEASCQLLGRAVQLPRPVGRSRATPAVVLADKAYSSRAIRRQLRQRAIRAVIPRPANQAANRKRLGGRGGRPPAFNREAYEQRNTVEC